MFMSKIKTLIDKKCNKCTKYKAKKLIIWILIKKKYWKV